MNSSFLLEIIKASEIEPKEVKWLWYPYIPFGKVKGHLGLDVKGNIDAIGNELADAFATNNLKKVTNIIDRHKIICTSIVEDDLKSLLISND